MNGNSLCKRPVTDSSDLDDTVKAILQNVKINGDFALYELEKKFDGQFLEEPESLIC